MAALVSLARFRGSRTLRLVALLLLVLAVSPFTAPFPTCDLGALTGNEPTHADFDSAEKKIQDSATDLVSHAYTFFVVTTMLPAHTAAAWIEPLPPPQLVLRI